MNVVTEYSSSVVMRFMNPFHAGTLQDQVNVISALAGSRASGASVRLWLQTSHNQVKQVRFQAYGCPHFIAAADILAEWCEGRSVAELSKWSRQAVEQSLEIPAAKRGRLLVLETALNNIIIQLHTTQAVAG